MYCTVTVWTDACDSVTGMFNVFVPEFPSVTLALAALTAGTSSFVMPPRAPVVVRVALVGLEKVTPNSSSNSLTVSPLIVIGIDLVVCPGENVSVPVLAT